MIETIKKYVEIWNTQQTKKLQTVFSQRALYKDALQGGNAIAVLENSIKEIAIAFPDILFEICSIIINDDKNCYVLEWVMKGTNTGSFFGAKPTNKVIEILGADIIHFEIDKVVSIKSFYDSSLFAKQLEL